MKKGKLREGILLILLILILISLVGAASGSVQLVSITAGGAAVSEQKEILVLGDSHYAGTFGKKLDNLLKSAGKSVQSYGCGSADANNYLNVGFSCKKEQGSTINSVVSNADYTLEGINNYLSKFTPSIVIVLLGGNIQSKSSFAEARKKQISDLVNVITSSGRKCIWVGPPGKEDPIEKVKRDEFYVQLTEALGNKCTLIDSRELAVLKVTDTSGHFKGGDKRAVNWANSVFEQLKNNLGSGGVQPVATLTSSSSQSSFLTDQGCSNAERCKEIDLVWKRMQTMLQLSGILAYYIWTPSGWTEYEEVYYEKEEEADISGSGAAAAINKLCVASQGSNEMRALLDTIAWAEGTKERYDIVVGFKQFSDKTQHPYYTDEAGLKEWFKKMGSTAAGRYQFLKGTYSELESKKNLGLFNDFTAVEQDEAAKYLVESKGVKQQELETAISSGDFQPIWDELAKTWASLPHSAKGGKSWYGQPSKKAEGLKKTYLACLDAHRGIKGVSGGAVCNSVNACLPYCVTNSYKNAGFDLDGESVNVVSEPPIKGVQYALNKDVLIPSALIAPLTAAGKIADDNGYGLLITSGYRTLREQFENACPSVIKSNFDSKIVAWPGASPHGTGRAVDLFLFKKGDTSYTRLSVDGDADAQCNLDKLEGNTILAAIMMKAGWERYVAEAWHFEYPPLGANTRTTSVSVPPSNCGSDYKNQMSPVVSGSVVSAILASTVIVEAAKGDVAVSSATTLGTTGTIKSGIIYKGVGVLQSTIDKWDEALVSQSVKGTTWIGKLESNGKDDSLKLEAKGRETIIFTPTYTNFNQPVEVIYYFHGLKGFDKWDMNERIAPQLKRMIEAKRNFVLVFPELSWSREISARYALSNYLTKIAWNGKDSDLTKFVEETEQIINGKLSKTGSMFYKGEVTMIGHSAGGLALKQAALIGALDNVRPNIITMSDAGYYWGTAKYVLSNGGTGTVADSATLVVWNYYVKDNTNVEYNLIVKHPDILNEYITQNKKDATEKNPTLTAIDLLNKQWDNFDGKSIIKSNKINYYPLKVDDLVPWGISSNPTLTSDLHDQIGRICLAWRSSKVSGTDISEALS